MEPRWLLLIHQLPPKPAYLRVKIWRQLQRLGAVAVKNSVYVLPRGEAAQEHFQWVRKEIVAGGGSASICEVRFVDGLEDRQIVALFQAARDADYAQIASDAGDAAGRFSARDGNGEGARADVSRLRHRLEEAASIDFFGASGRSAAEGSVASLEERLKPRAPGEALSKREPLRREDYRRRTWVTRKGIHVDRMASAWLIRRFVDPQGKLRFVDARGHAPHRGELRFDMFEAEFTHEGDRCTFEVLLDRFGIHDPALLAIAEIVHDIDLKDGKFGRTETPGIERVVTGIALTHKDDASRVARSADVLDELHEAFRRQGAAARPAPRSRRARS